MNTHRNMWPYLWLAIALIAYSLPWQWHTTHTLTLNAYDLAEWQSVLASSQDSLAALVASLSLRLPLLVMTVVFAYLTRGAADNLHLIARWIIIGLLIIAQLPPLTALTSIFRDANNAQQFTLAGLSLLMAIGISLRKSPVDKWLVIGLVAIFVIGGLFGIAQTMAAFNGLGITVMIGAGGVLLAGVMWGFLLIPHGEAA